MPRCKSLWNRKFRGNQFSNSDKSNKQQVNAISLNEENSHLDFEVRSNEETTSSSKKKLSYISEFVKNVADENTSKNVIIDLDIVSALIQKFVKCKYCEEENCVVLTEDCNARKGLACKLSISCTKCDSKKTAMSSKVTRHRLYEVNSRFAYGLRSIVKVKLKVELCAVLNLSLIHI